MPDERRLGTSGFRGFGNSIPAFVGNKTGAIPDPLPLLKELNQLAHELDPSRPTTLATCCEGIRYAPDTVVPITGSVTDLSGANRYFGWYYGTPSDLALILTPCITPGLHSPWL